MGYRSDVAVAFYSVAEEHNAVIKLWLDENLPFKDWDLSDAWTPIEDRGWLFHIESVKWYESYPEVEAMDKVIKEFVALFIEGENNEQTAALEFVRLGEESNDNEETRYGYGEEGMLDISREIDIDTNRG
jgi:hypothetical protein